MQQISAYRHQRSVEEAQGEISAGTQAAALQSGEHLTCDGEAAPADKKSRDDNRLRSGRQLQDAAGEFKRADKQRISGKEGRKHTKEHHISADQQRCMTPVSH